MIYAFLSDIHGNLEALTAVLKEIDAAKPEAIYCLGDIVGYGASPRECLDLLRERNIPAVLGNHDAAACGMISDDYFNDEARASVRWTRQALQPEDLDYLRALPLARSGDLFTIVHSTMADPAAYDYVLTAYDAIRCFQAHEKPVIFIGHSHVPGVFLLDGDVLHASSAPEVRLGPSLRAIVNVGSVGQPRDQDPRACYCLLDTDAHLITLRRAAYNIELAAAKILSAGLPSLNAYRLLLGR